MQSRTVMFAAMSLGLLHGVAGDAFASLLELQVAYEQRVKEVDAAHAAGMAKLDEGYAKALESLSAKSKQSGDLDQSLAVANEIKRFAADKLPPALPSGVPELQKLMDTYREEAEKRGREKAGKMLPLASGYDKALDQLEKKLVTAGDLKGAQAIRAERQAKGEFLKAAVKAAEVEQVFPARAEDWITYEPKDGPDGKGKHLVFLAGDEEYRSEEGLPMLAKILSQRHGFRCTVLFSVNDKGEIDPDNQKSLSNPAALDEADAIVMLLRFRNWPEETFKHFDAALARGVPVIGLRTSTHAFNNGSHGMFGKEVLGEQWVSHWGGHKSEATRGVIEAAAKEMPILRGVEDVFGDSDVYEAYPPGDATILLRGAVLKGMGHDDPPADYKKKRSSDQAEQGVNDPMMPVAWTRVVENKHAGVNTGKPRAENRIFCTTLGAATDLESEGLRRLVVNAVFWGLGLEVPAKANVEVVDPYHPSDYGFKSYRTGISPADHALGKSLPPR